MRGALGFLDNDSRFGRICTAVGTIIVANLLFVVTLLPLITAGAGLCGLYYSMLKLVRYQEINPLAEFWSGFRDNFKKATLTMLCLVAGAVFLAIDLRICALMTEPLCYCSVVLYGAVIILAVLAMYAFPVMATFEGSMRDTFKLSVYFAVGNVPGTLAIVLLHVVPLVLTYLDIALLPLAAFLWCLCGFAVITLCNARILMRRFACYLEPVEQESQEKEHKRVLEEMKMLEG
ncbi:YesL family protein [Agathobaculum sp. LCP25S3_E8]|uniref:YesL family protein n=1 Tax=Agathobaculum sp. LCP25S3_E8 TaxID=3438735 RepID=UPI003F91F8A3